MKSLTRRPPQILFFFFFLEKRNQKVIYCTCVFLLGQCSSFAQVSTVSTAASRSSSVFAQVSGGELKSTRLWRAAHSIYCPDPISKRSWRGLSRVCGWGWWMRLGGLEEELTEVSVGVEEEDLTAGTHGWLSTAQRPKATRLLTPSPPDLFIYLPFSCIAEGREQSDLAWE